MDLCRSNAVVRRNLVDAPTLKLVPGDDVLDRDPVSGDPSLATGNARGDLQVGRQAQRFLVKSKGHRVPQELLAVGAGLNLLGDHVGQIDCQLHGDYSTGCWPLCQECATSPFGGRPKGVADQPAPRVTSSSCGSKRSRRRLRSLSGVMLVDLAEMPIQAIPQDPQAEKKPRDGLKHGTRAERTEGVPRLPDGCEP